MKTVAARVVPALAILLVIGLLAGRCLPSPERSPEHRHNFTGMSEAKVRDLIGEPDFPRFEAAGYNVESFAYGYTWTYYVGAYLTLYFNEDGVVVREERGSK